MLIKMKKKVLSKFRGVYPTRVWLAVDHLTMYYIVHFALSGISFKGKVPPLSTTVLLMLLFVGVIVAKNGGRMRFHGQGLLYL